MNQQHGDPDALKMLENICSADPRSDDFAEHDITRNGNHVIAARHAEISKLSLVATVPRDVYVQYETAKNLYLYAWFVYRFLPVAEHHALTCLEFGLKRRFHEPLPKKYWDKPWRPTLRPLLNFAIDNGFIKDEGFRRWHDHTRFRAQQRYSDERLTEMIESGLPEIEVDYTLAVPNDEDRAWSYLPTLQTTLPEKRNSYAHGSSSLHNHVLGTFEVVGEILNQLYKEQSK